MKPAASAASAGGVRQASECWGPKLSAVDRVTATRPVAAAPAASTMRRQPGRDTA